MFAVHMATLASLTKRNALWVRHAVNSGIPEPNSTDSVGV